METEEKVESEKADVGTFQVGSKVDLVYNHGNGHGKIVALYQNWAMVIHPWLPNPTAIHIDNLELH